MIKQPTKVNCTKVPCAALAGIDVIRLICLVCEKKKDEPYYVVDGIPGICQSCAEEIKQRKPPNFQI